MIPPFITFEATTTETAPKVAKTVNELTDKFLRLYPYEKGSLSAKVFIFLGFGKFSNYTEFFSSKSFSILEQD